LGGTAKGWYETLPIEDRKDYTRLRDKLVKAFQRIEVPVRRLQELIGRNQQPDETVGAYAYAKLKLCNQLDRHMTERNKVIYFIQGLRREIQNFVSIKDPSSWEEALKVARKKEESLIDLEVGKVKVRQIETQDSRNDQSIVLEKIENLQKSLHNEIAEMSYKIRKIEDRRQGPSRGVDLNGRIICHGCKKPGHYIRNCPEREKEERRGNDDQRREERPNRARRGGCDRDERWKNRQYDGLKKKENERN
jgi:hypothetical protein